MSFSTWDREETAATLRPKLWRYLSISADVIQTSSRVSDFPLARNDLVRLYATHLALSESTQEALGAAAVLLRHMPSTSAVRTIEMDGEVRGQVNWPLTQSRRIARGDPTVFVCSPAERRYDTPLGRLIQTALRCIAQLAELSTLAPAGEVGKAVHRTSDRARRLLLHPKIAGVRRISPSALRHTDALVARRPIAVDLVSAVRQFVSGIIEADAKALHSLLEQQFLAPREDSRLFELKVGFEILEALEEVGFEVVPPLPLLPGGSTYFATLRRGDESAVVHWQRPAWVLPGDSSKTGLWWKTLDANGLSQHPLLPDFIVDIPSLRRRFVIEVKLTSLSEGSRDRDGIRDVFAYLTDAQALFVDSPHPHAFVVAWNSAAVVEDPSAPYLVVNQSSFGTQLANVLGMTSDA